MYNVGFGRIVGPGIAHEYEYVVRNLFWREFEKHLGSVDENFIVGTNEYDLGLENPDPIDIEMNDDRNAEKLKNAFVLWVKDTLDQDENYELISNVMGSKGGLININPEEYFLQFNYTHTLQELYDVEDYQVHYVHGECHGNEDDELIVGHGNDDRLEDISQKINDLEAKYNFSQSSRNEINEYRCVHRYLEKTRKDVDWCKDMCSYFYDSIRYEIENINVYGLSLGEVDIPYMNDIRNRWRNATWKFSYYSSGDKTRIEKIAVDELNLHPSEFELFELFEFKNVNSNDINCEIVKLMNIEEHDYV